MDLFQETKKSIQSGVFSSKVWDSIKGIEKGTEEYEIFFSQLNQLPTLLPGLSKLKKGNKQDQLNAFHQYFRLILFQFGYNTISLLKSWIKVMKLHLSSNHIEMTNEFEMLLDVFVENGNEPIINQSIRSFFLFQNDQLKKYLKKQLKNQKEKYHFFSNLFVEKYLEILSDENIQIEIDFQLLKIYSIIFLNDLKKNKKKFNNTVKLLNKFIISTSDNIWIEKSFSKLFQYLIEIFYIKEPNKCIEFLKNSNSKQIFIDRITPFLQNFYLHIKLIFNEFDEDNTIGKETQIKMETHTEKGKGKETEKKIKKEKEMKQKIEIKQDKKMKQKKEMKQEIEIKNEKEIEKYEEKKKFPILQKNLKKPQKENYLHNKINNLNYMDTETGTDTEIEKEIQEIENKLKKKEKRKKNKENYEKPRYEIMDQFFHLTKDYPKSINEFTHSKKIFFNGIFLHETDRFKELNSKERNEIILQNLINLQKKYYYERYLRYCEKKNNELLRNKAKKIEKKNSEYQLIKNELKNKKLEIHKKKIEILQIMENIENKQKNDRKLRNNNLNFLKKSLFESKKINTKYNSMKKQRNEYFENISELSTKIEIIKNRNNNLQIEFVDFQEKSEQLNNYEEKNKILTQQLCLWEHYQKLFPSLIYSYEELMDQITLKKQEISDLKQYLKRQNVLFAEKENQYEIKMKSRDQIHISNEKLEKKLKSARENLAHLKNDRRHKLLTSKQHFKQLIKENLAHKKTIETFQAKIEMIQSNRNSKK
ncbi:hypothetical protein M0812_24697 [Anaeramoeba flamelloides]|uniref:Uncharacterized protein n=1 Tax=Anaeramoeba flamelloides TaxID=1746091 RepID=A0AAV7YKH6_9EUKA|nr:hypothetical protein M0812_24697 [Anaeramoeba flamelloides]